MHCLNGHPNPDHYEYCGECGTALTIPHSGLPFVSTMGAHYPGHAVDFTLSYKATGLGVFTTLIAAKTKAAQHAADHTAAVATLRKSGWLN